ncbi:MAG: putative metal-binding motif-containing protein [Nanoarchaeota archaeon]
MDSIIGGGPEQKMEDGYHPINYEGKDGDGIIVRTDISNFDEITLQPYSANIISLVENTECQNGVINVGEVCDGTDLGGESCTSQGFDSGTLGCSIDCQSYDTSSCSVNPTCATCEECDTLFTPCSEQECHTDCNPGTGCYYRGDILLLEDCVSLTGVCSSVTTCSDYPYAEFECENNPCGVVGGCFWDGNNCISSLCSDSDLDGYGVCPNCGTANGCSYEGDDCNDDDENVHPGADESVCNGVDNDCDLSTDEDYVETPTTCGVGECAGNTGALQCIDGSEIDSCDPFEGAVPESCEDETGYDELDNNCDGTVDLDCESYCDQDTDTYSPHLICALAGYATGDCDDSSTSINPGETEIPCNGVDENCNVNDDEGTDSDGDNYKIDGGLCGAIDCNDDDADIYPNAPELCDFKDNQCSGNSGYGTEDEGCSCVDLGGDVCLTTPEPGEICSGNEIIGDGSLSNCCDEECVAPTPGTCSDCGNGLFNICDRTECHAITEECYFEDGPLFTCTQCSALSCKDYLDEADCNSDRCNVGGCGWDGNNCVTIEECSNDVIDSGEVCDGTDLGEETCVSQGFDSGTLACSEDCQSFDTSGCQFDPVVYLNFDNRRWKFIWMV